MPIRSFLFNVLFYTNLTLFVLLGSVFFFTPRAWSMAALRLWARVSLKILEKVGGISHEIRGQEHLPQGPCVLIGKHQSLWETFALFPLLKDPAIILKRELSWIPFFGWFARKFKMILVDRKAQVRALTRLVSSTQTALSLGRQVILFPEGTRRAIGAPPAYKSGASALYKACDAPFVPFALNSGVYWPRRAPLAKKGTIILEFLPPLPQSLPRKDFEARLAADIEGATRALVAEAQSATD